MNWATSSLFAAIVASLWILELDDPLAEIEDCLAIL
jgi:hypothetical protein